MNELTDEQVANWRRALIGLVGPYALLMSKKEIQAFCDRMNKKAEQGFCQCDPKREGKTKNLNGTVTCNKCHKERKDNS